MKAVEFPEVNLRIAENQPEYETLPVHVEPLEPGIPVTMCFELDENEKKQVAETGKIWLKVLTFGNNFQPISMSCLKPEGMTDPDDLEECTSCNKKFPLEIMESDSGGNWFCPECWKELAPVMKAEHEEMVQKGFVD